MSNEVNISQLANGTLDPGWWVEWYMPRPNYDAAKKKVAFFTIVPDPFIDGIEVGPLVGQTEGRDLEITRTWNTVWSTGTTQGTNHVFQRNVRIINPGPLTAAYELLVAETDN